MDCTVKLKKKFDKIFSSFFKAFSKKKGIWWTLYQKLKRLTEGCKLGASSCKDEMGNLVTDKALQNDVEQFLQLRQGRIGPLRTF